MTDDNPLYSLFPDASIDKATHVSALMGNLMNLSHENFVSSMTEIQDDFYPTSDDDKIHFLFEILFAVRYRPLSIELLSRLFSSIFQSDQTENEIMKKMLLDFLFRLDFQNSAHLCFLYHLYKIGFVEIDSILASLEKFLSVCGRRIEAPLLVYAWFAPEIEDDSQYSKVFSLIKNVEERLKSRNGLSDSMELFLSQLSELKKNNWKLYNECREFGFNSNDLYKIIKNDDIDKFQTLTYTFGFDMNQMVPDSIFERVLFLKDGARPVHIASFYGSIKIFKFLLLNGADLSLRDMASNNVMHFAVAGGNFQIIRILEQEQWNLHGTPKVATRFHRFEIFEWLHDSKYNENNEEINVLLFASQSNNVESILRCIELKCDVNIRNKNKETPLYHSVMSRSLDCLELLVTCKTADLMCVDNEKSSLLHVAARRNFYEGMKLLLSLDVINVNARDIYGETPLIIAANYGHKEIIELLLENPNINPDLQIKNGGPIHLCLQTDNVSLMKLLLKTQRFNLNTVNEASFTPLHVAAIRNLPEAITALCNEPSVNVNALDQTGQSALCMSIESCDIEAVQAFLASEREFDMEQKQMDELTPLEIARRTGNCKIIEMVENYVNNSNK